MSWWYDAKDNTVVQSDGVPPGLVPHDTVFGPFATQAEAQQEQTAWLAVSGAAKQTTAPLLGGFLGNLGEWVLRIGEVVLGIVIVAVAANAMLKRA